METGDVCGDCGDEGFEHTYRREAQAQVKVYGLPA